MPGLLRPSARCPMCDTPLLGLVDTTRSRWDRVTVTREYSHEKPEIGRRKGRCVKVFTNYEIAQRELRRLEV